LSHLAWYSDSNYYYYYNYYYNHYYNYYYNYYYVIVRPLSTVGYTSAVASVIHSRQWAN